MSNNELSTHNDIAELYNQAPLEGKNGTLLCPVCKKSYKRESALVTHMEKMDCYKLGDIFKNTLYEDDALEVFSGLMDKRMPMFVFRKSTLYTPVLRFVIFCYHNEIKDMGAYYSYVSATMKRTNPQYIIKVATDKAGVVQNYRDFLQSNPELINDDFLETNKERLLEDTNFLVRSVEKAHVSIETIASMDEFQDVINDLPTDYFLRLEEIYERTSK